MPRYLWFVCVCVCVCVCVGVCVGVLCAVCVCISQYILSHGNMSVFGGMALWGKLPGRPSSLETPHPHQVKQFRTPWTRDLKGFTGRFLKDAP